jgi:hypothetical protein
MIDLVGRTGNELLVSGGTEGKGSERNVTCCNGSLPGLVASVRRPVGVPRSTRRQALHAGIVLLLGLVQLLGRDQSGGSGLGDDGAAVVWHALAVVVRLIVARDLPLLSIQPATLAFARQTGLERLVANDEFTTSDGGVAARG